MFLILLNVSFSMKQEFHKWFPRQRVGVLHNTGSYSGKKKESLVRDINKTNGTLITSYQVSYTHQLCISFTIS